MSNRAAKPRFVARLSSAPRVEIDRECAGVYVRLKRGGKTSRTIVQNEWPHIAVDLDARGEVLGVEALGVKEFTVAPILRMAGVTVAPDVLRRARYLAARAIVPA
jgi:hypothetical protein